MNANVEYLKNELGSYKIMKYRLDNNLSTVDNQISYCQRKIRDIDIRLSAGNAKGIDYTYVPGNRMNEPLLAMLAEQEEYQLRLNELLTIKDQELKGYLSRIKYVDQCLSRLNDQWKIDFVKEHYIEGVSIDSLKCKSYSRSSLYDNRDKILLEMLSSDFVR